MLDLNQKTIHSSFILVPSLCEDNSQHSQNKLSYFVAKKFPKLLYLKKIMVGICPKDLALTNSLTIWKGLIHISHHNEKDLHCHTFFRVVFK